MKTHFNKTAKEWKVRTVDILPKHNLFFGSPVNDPLAGIPLGDGDIGTLVWVDEQRLHLNINKCDLWDDSSVKDGCVCSQFDEDLTSLRHGGEITVRFHNPCFDVFYQDKFESFLSLPDATAHLISETPFGRIKFSSFASAALHTGVLHGEMRFTEPESPEIELFRFGSRNFWRWYQRIKHSPTAGLSGTNALSDSNRLYITQELNGTCFCIGVAVISKENFRASVTNSHSCKLLFEKTQQLEFDLYYTISCADTADRALKDCTATLTAAMSKGVDLLYNEHKTDWARFWNTSCISIPDDYIENIYYLSLYYSRCECRGKYPPHFTCGLWSFRHDFIPWNYYFFYNMQHMYGPLNAAGHGELAENYFAMRKAGLENAKLYARERKHLDGAFYHDVTDRYGRGADYDAHNCTPTSQLALAAWRYYRYCGDEEFLNETVIPIADGAARLYLSMLKRGSDGLYHLDGTTAYEGNPPCRDAITDMVMIKALFPIVCHFADTDLKAQCQDVLDHLPDFIRVKVGEHDMDGEVFGFGLGKGKKPYGDGSLLAMGMDNDGNPLRRTYGDPACDRYGFPDVELSPLYPAGIVGLADKGKPLFDILKNQMLLHTADSGCMHWCMGPLYLARLGMSELLNDFLRTSVSLWQVYPNGFNGDGPMGVRQAKHRMQYELSSDYETERSSLLEAYPFRYFDFETTPIVAHAASEALLQSYDGILRVCPAVRQQDEVFFHLFAEGGFQVTAEITAETYLITVISLFREECLLKLPEYSDVSTLHIYRITDADYCEAAPKWCSFGDERVLNLSDALRTGNGVLICSAGVEELMMVPYQTEKANRNMKKCRNAVLGSPILPSAVQE